MKKLPILKRFLRNLLLALLLVASIYCIIELTVKLASRYTFKVHVVNEPQETEITVELPAEEINLPFQVQDLGMYTITGYCACEKCCGEWANNRPNGIVYGASGDALVATISAAALQETLPYGSVVFIEGLGIRIIQDTGPDYIFEKYDGKLLDLYCDSHEAAIELDKTERRVFLLNGNNDGTRYIGS